MADTDKSAEGRILEGGLGRAPPENFEAERF